jgi:hypothetical protein
MLPDATIFDPSCFATWFHFKHGKEDVLFQYPLLLDLVMGPECLIRLQNLLELDLILFVARFIMVWVILRNSSSKCCFDFYS